MNLITALRVKQNDCIAFVGAGGKTSAIFELARQLSAPVMVTATTHMAQQQLYLADKHYQVENPEDVASIENHLHKGINLITGPVGSDQRTAGLSAEILTRLKTIADDHNLPILIEADGSRQRPLKAPGENEPVIPGFVDSVVVVAGLSALGKPLSEEWVHRPEQFTELSGLSLGDEITPLALAEVMKHDHGGLKHIPNQAGRIALLNQVNTEETKASAQSIAAMLTPEYDAVVIADLAHYTETRESQVEAVHEPVAAIILAAGGSERFGEPKQLLDWGGRPFIRQIANTSLEAGLSPVVVVTGAYHEQVQAAIADLPVSIAHNPNWQTGQSESVKIGLGALPKRTGAVIFLLVDQPQVPVTLLHKLIATHAVTLAPIVAPEVDGQRGNPVLFDRSTFPEFKEISGDVGGRAIFSRHRITWVPWLDSSLAIDVDTPEDYLRLINYYK